MTFGNLRFASASSSSRPARNSAAARVCRSGIAACVCLNDACIYGEAFALHQASIHAGSDDGLEHMPQDVAIAEAAVAIDRERRVIRHLVIEVQTTEPSISEVHLDFLA